MKVEAPPVALPTKAWTPPAAAKALPAVMPTAVTAPAVKAAALLPPAALPKANLGWDSSGGTRALRTTAKEVLANASRPELQARYREPGDLPAAVTSAKGELSKVTTRTAEGKPTHVLAELDAAPGLTGEQKQRVFRCIARVKDFFERAGSAGPAEAKYQRINLLHTYGELGKVLEASRAMKLSPEQTEDALLASMFTDVDKTAGIPSLLTHHQAGGRAASVFLGRELPQDAARVARVVQYVKDHQVSPPAFFSIMIQIGIRNAAKEQGVDLGPLEGALKTLRAKIAEPLDPAHLQPSGDALALTADEAKLMGLIGLEEWTVPTEPAAFAVVAGDGMINYATADGVAKMVAIRGPGTPFKDPTAQDSVASVLGDKGSGVDCKSVLPEMLKPLFDQGTARTRLAVAAAEKTVDGWLKGKGRDPAATPFWRTTPLSYDDPAAVALALEIRGQFEAALRDEHTRA